VTKEAFAHALIIEQVYKGHSRDKSL